MGFGGVSLTLTDALARISAGQSGSDEEERNQAEQKN